MEKKTSIQLKDKWLECLDTMPKDIQVEVISAIASYCLTGAYPENISLTAKAIMFFIEKDIKDSKSRSQRMLSSAKAKRSNGRAQVKHCTQSNENQDVASVKATRKSKSALSNNIIYNNNINNNLVETLPERKKAFEQSLQPYIETYGSDIIQEFFMYWSECNKSKTKMRWEMEKTWETKKRLVRWANGSKKFETNNHANQRPRFDPRRGTDASDIPPEEYDQGF